jgi:hypothetical protein
VLSFLKDICRIVGHEGVDRVTNSPREMVMILGGICTRCSAGSIVRVKYIDLYCRGYNVLEKAQARLKESLDR